MSSVMSTNHCRASHQMSRTLKQRLNPYMCLLLCNNSSDDCRYNTRAFTVDMTVGCCQLFVAI